MYSAHRDVAFQTWQTQVLETCHVTTELGAADENRQLVPLASQAYPFSSRRLNPKAKKRVALGVTSSMATFRKG